MFGLLGRLPRAFNPRVPHLSALRFLGRQGGAAPPAPPAAVDWTTGLPANLGMMGNNSLGDCTCAAAFHALQVWSQRAQGSIDTEPDSQAIALYSAACGYVQGQPNTDQGGVEQDVLSYWMLTGIPLASGGVQKLTAFVEVDPTNQADVKCAIADCGVCYIGFSVPDYAMSTTGTWDVQPGTPNIVGGHAVVLAAYDAEGPTCITWGRLQRMTWAFFSQFTDEAYMLADADWFGAQGACPAGLTLDQLEAQMQALKESAGS